MCPCYNNRVIKANSFHFGLKWKSKGTQKFPIHRLNFKTSSCLQLNGYRQDEIYQSYHYLKQFMINGDCCGIKSQYQICCWKYHALLIFNVSTRNQKGVFSHDYWTENDSNIVASLVGTSTLVDSELSKTSNSFLPNDGMYTYSWLILCSLSIISWWEMSDCSLPKVYLCQF